ncbi:MAG TPA: WhiB family transcriptional regulator [Actinocrinis sp.]|nr:WhiB family transcriptional regulator [Actinocrinis sp.]
MSPSGSDVLVVLAAATRAARPRSAPDVYATLDLSWQKRGSCRDVDPSLFFGPEGEARNKRRFREAAAKAICSYCPVRAACRSFALTTGEPYGIWGGTTETERMHKPPRRHKVAPAPAASRRTSEPHRTPQAA